jgi:hypothetical protein
VEKITASLSISGAILFAFLSIAPAQADLAITWVSSATEGNDSHDCSFDAPCRTFQGALAKTNAGGEIRVRNRGSFGVVTITKSISIIGWPAGAGILSRDIDEGGGLTTVHEGIVIKAPATSVVNLRGLVIDGLGGGNAGISFQSGRQLHIQNCTIRNVSNDTFGGIGIEFISNNGGELYVTDTLIADNGHRQAPIDKVAGILVRPTGGSTTVILDRVRLESNVSGIFAEKIAGAGPISITLRDSVVAGNFAWGVGTKQESNTKDFALLLDRTAVVGNGGGIEAPGLGTLRISNSIVSGNRAFGVIFNNGNFDISKNNSIRGNGTDGNTPGSLGNLSVPNDSPP